MKHLSKTRRFGYAASLHERGITLIELMVVMVIIAILTTIAYPSYQRYVARTHRNAAAACLSQYAQALERRYTTTLTYVGGENTDLGCRRQDDLDRFYTITVPRASLSQSAYTVQAAPTPVQTAADDPRCGTLSITNTGARLPAENACW